MLQYEKALRIFRDSKHYNFENDTILVVENFYSDDRVMVDFSNMTEEMFDELSDGQTSYNDAVHILNSSKRFTFDQDNCSTLIVSDYYTGDEVRIDFSRMSQDTYENLAMEMDDEYDEDMEDDFADAVGALDYGGGLSK